MDIHLITSDPQLLAELEQQAQTLAMPVRTALCRQNRQPLAPLLEKITHGIVLLESEAPQESEDWDALNRLTRRHPQLNVIMMSHDSSKEHLLSAMRSGVREVMACPPDMAALNASLKRFSQRPDDIGLANAPTQPRGRLIAFMACKGGAGATFVATSMAHMMASEFQRPCAFIDLDLQYGDASFYVGSFEHPHTMTDLATQIERLDPLLMASCMQPVIPGLQLLAAPDSIDKALGLHAGQIEKVLSMACAEHRLVVVDLPRSMDALSLKALDMADDICLVMDSTMAALRDAQRLLQLFQSLGYPSEKLRLFINKVPRDEGIDHPTVQASLGIPIRHSVPEQAKVVNECINLGQAIGQMHPQNPVAVALRKATAELLQVPLPPHPGWIARWFGRSTGTHSFSTAGASLETRHS